MVKQFKQSRFIVFNEHTMLRVSVERQTDGQTDRESERERETDKLYYFDKQKIRALNN